MRATDTVASEATHASAFVIATAALRDAHGLAHAVMKLAEHAEERRDDLDTFGILLSAVTGLEQFLAFQLGRMDRVETAVIRAGRKAEAAGA